MQPGDHLFRHESGRMVAALTRIFGIHNLALAEDVVQDAFCRALEVWRISVGSKRSARSPIAVAWPHIRSTLRRSASSNFAAGGMTPRASTSEQRSHWRETQWNADSSIAASARANEATRSGDAPNNFGKLISKPRTQAEQS